MKRILCWGVCFSLLLLTGCWDRKELNDRAIWLALGLDLTKNGNTEISGQIIIPSNAQTPGGGGGGGGGGAGGPGYFTISAIGKNVSDAMQNMQTKLPREAFVGQRRVIFLGEKYAKQGLKNKLDIHNRSSDVSLRTDIFVIKGADAKDVIELSNPMEKAPVVATLKEHRQSGGRGDTSYLKFLMAATRDGIRPTIPTIELANSVHGKNEGENSPAPKVLRLAGVSIFDKNLKMKGYLNDEENRDMLWIMGVLKKMVITLPTKHQSASINLTKIGCKIEPKFTKTNQLSFQVTLTGEGTLVESNSGLDVQYTGNLKKLEKQFELAAQKQVQQTITKVQKKYGEDIFGFGELIHKKHPSRWKSLQKDWDRTFPKTSITCQANLKIKRIGMDGPSLLYKGK